MSDYPMLISNKLHSFRNFAVQIYDFTAFRQICQAWKSVILPVNREKC